MELLKTIWFVLKEFPIFKWATLVGFGLYIFGGGSLKLLGYYLLIADAILIAGFLSLVWISLEEDKAEQWKKNSYEFHNSLNQDKYKTKSKSSFDNTEHPVESLQANTNKSKESATKLNSTFDNIPYPSSNKSIQQPIKLNEQLALKEVHKTSTSVVLPDGHIKCGSCKYQNSPDKFLQSSAGDLHRKCPQCNMHTQFFDNLKSDGKKYTCPSCKFSGDKSSFFPSSAGNKHLRCPSCPTHFM